MLCQSSREFLGELLSHSPDTDPLCFSPHKPDAGWSRLWQIIERRIRAPQLEMPLEQQAGDPISRGQQHERQAAVRAVSSPALRAEKVMLDGAAP